MNNPSGPGIIRNRDHIIQIRNFRNLRFGSISPTDIDAFFEINDKVYVFIETKKNGANIPRGQLLAFERLCDVVGISKKAIFIIGCHESNGEDEDIDVAACKVLKYRSRGRWLVPPHEITVRALIGRYMRESLPSFTDAEDYR